MLHRNLSNSLHHIQSQSCLYNYSDLNMGMEEGGGGGHSSKYFAHSACCYGNGMCVQFHSCINSLQ